MKGGGGGNRHPLRTSPSSLEKREKTNVCYEGYCIPPSNPLMLTSPFSYHHCSSVIRREELREYLELLRNSDLVCDL